MDLVIIPEYNYPPAYDRQDQIRQTPPADGRGITDRYRRHAGRASRREALPLLEDNVTLSHGGRQVAASDQGAGRAVTTADQAETRPERPNKPEKDDNLPARRRNAGNTPYATKLTRPYIPRGQFVSTFG